jgi:hypothetical protein
VRCSECAWLASELNVEHIIPNAMLQICNTQRGRVRHALATLPCARTNTAGRLGRVPTTYQAQILISLYFVRCLTFNSFSVLFPRPTERQARPTSANTNYLSKL